MIVLWAPFNPPVLLQKLCNTSLQALNAISEEEVSANKLPSTGGSSALLKGTSEMFQKQALGSGSITTPLVLMWT